MISVQFHDGVVSLCDKELLGKRFEDSKHSLFVTERFYKGKFMNRKGVIKILENADSINLVGTKIVKIALEEGFITQENILMIQGVPHVQIYTFQ